MREYGKVSPTFWTGTTGRALRGLGVESVVVGFYLMTSPGSNMLGLYYQPILFMAHETGLGLEGAQKGLRGCIEAGFCHYDTTTEMVWVVEMAAWQIAEELKASDKRCLGIQRDYEALPVNPFLGQFFDRYRKAFNLTERRTPEGAPKPLPSKEQAKEQAKAKEQDLELSPTAPATPAAPPAGQLTLVAVDGKKVSRQSADEVVDLVLRLYHELLPACRSVAVKNPKLRKKILDADKLASATIREQGLKIDRAFFWEAFFGECQDDPWLRGDLPNPNNAAWKQNLDVLLKEERFAEIVNRALARPRGDSGEAAA